MDATRDTSSIPGRPDNFGWLWLLEDRRSPEARPARILKPGSVVRCGTSADQRALVAFATFRGTVACRVRYLQPPRHGLAKPVQIVAMVDATDVLRQFVHDITTSTVRELTETRQQYKRVRRVLNILENKIVAVKRIQREVAGDDFRPAVVTEAVTEACEAVWWDALFIHHPWTKASFRQNLHDSLAYKAFVALNNDLTQRLEPHIARLAPWSVPCR